MLPFTFESTKAEQTFVEVASALDHVSFNSTHTDVFTKEGVLGDSWRLRSPQPTGRRILHWERCAQVTGMAGSCPAAHPSQGA